MRQRVRTPRVGTLAQGLRVVPAPLHVRLTPRRPGRTCTPPSCLAEPSPTCATQFGPVPTQYGRPGDNPGPCRVADRATAAQRRAQRHVLGHGTISLGCDPATLHRPRQHVRQLSGHCAHASPCVRVHTLGTPLPGTWARSLMRDPNTTRSCPPPSSQTHMSVPFACGATGRGGAERGELGRDVREPSPAPNLPREGVAPGHRRRRRRRRRRWRRFESGRRLLPGGDREGGEVGWDTLKHRAGGLLSPDRQGGAPRLAGCQQYCS